MGYMGFGMSKENYTLKVRKGFKNLSNILEKEHYHISNKDNEEKKVLTEIEIHRINSVVKVNRKRNFIRNLMAAIITIIIFVGIYLLVVLIYK